MALPWLPPLLPSDDDDLISGYAGPDTLDGGGGDDRIYADSGNDILLWWQR